VVPVFIAKSFAIRLVDRRSKRPDCIFHPTEDLPSVLVIRAAEELTGIDTAHAREELSEPIAARRGTAVFDLGGKFLQFLFRERSRLDRIAFDKGDVCPIGVLEQNSTPIAFGSAIQRQPRVVLCRVQSSQQIPERNAIGSG
jgi:hypothetical protein